MIYNKIAIKRGLKANLPASLREGELAYCTDTSELYIGTTVGNVLLNYIVEAGEDPIDTTLDNLEADLNLALAKNYSQDKELADLKETILRASAGEEIGSVTGTEIIHLGKDVANAGLKVKQEGLLLDASNLVSDTPIADSATETFTTVNGVDYYVNDGTTSSIITGDGNDYTLTNNTGGLATMFAYNIDTLKANKQYSPLSETTFDLMLDASIVNQMDLWVQNGTLPNSIQSESFDKKVVSVGKNLVEEEISQGIFSKKYSIIPNESYTISISDITNATNWRFAYMFYKNGVNISDTVDVSKINRASFFTAGLIIWAVNGTFLTDGWSNIDADEVTIRISLGDTIATSKTENLQLEQGSTATAYAPYVSTEQFIEGGVGYSVGNVKDSIEPINGQLVKTQRIGADLNDVMQSATSWSIDYVLTNTQSFEKNLESLLGYKTPTSNVLSNIYVRIGTTIFTVVPPTSTDYVNNDTENLVTISSSSGNILFRVNKTTYPTSADFETYLQANDVSFYYELATPITTLPNVSGNLQAYPNGTVYFLNETYEVLAYDSGLTTDKDISSVKECVKIGSDGTQTVIDTSDITLTSNQVSAISGATDGDIYYIVYEYTGDYVQGLKTVSYYDDRFVVVDDVTGTVYKWKVVADNGVFSIEGEAI